jgi:flagellar basal-body rod protein FlgC
MTDAIAAAQSALSAMGTTMAVAANNVANVDTEGYRSKEARLETGPDGQGVRVADITPDAAPAGLPAETGLAQPGVDLSAMSDVDLAGQAVSMTLASRAFEANAAVIRTADDLAGTLLDLRI